MPFFFQFLKWTYIYVNKNKDFMFIGNPRGISEIALQELADKFYLPKQ